MSVTRASIREHFCSGFQAKDAQRAGAPRRIGLELKFPAVQQNGEACGPEFAPALFQFAVDRLGWRPHHEGKRLVGAWCAGPQNDSHLGCETSFCKIELALAHQPDLPSLETDFRRLLAELAPFFRQTRVRLLGLGVQPLSEPSPDLLQKKSRNVFWNRVFAKSPEEEKRSGVHLFTVNASNQVHLDVSSREAAQGLNVFNASAALQIALLANSPFEGGVVTGVLDGAEMLWDRWLPDDVTLCGLPPRPVKDLNDWVDLLFELRPVYVQRPDGPVGLMRYRSFGEYLDVDGGATGETREGGEVGLTPMRDDFDLHTTFNWFCARLSQYHTLEHRVCDQQPPDALFTPGALSLGILENLEAARGMVEEHPWETWRRWRVAAAQKGLEGAPELPALCERWLAVADEGLRRRGLGEERYLAPLHVRLKLRRAPASDAVHLFTSQGLDVLLKQVDVLSAFGCS